VPPVVRTRIDAGDPSERLAFALIERHLQNRGVRTESTARALKSRIDRAREEMRGTPRGAEEARRIVEGITANGGAMLRTVQRSCVELRPFAARAAVRLVALVREHDIRSTAALVLLGSAAQWTALADALRDLVFERGPAATPGDGPSFGELLKLARDASNAARLDLLSALDVEKRTRDARDDDGVIDGEELARRVAALHAPQPEPPQDASDEASAGDTEEDVATRPGGEEEPDDGVWQRSDPLGELVSESAGLIARAISPVTVAPMTSTGTMPAQPRVRQLLVAQGGAVGFPPPRATAQSALDRGKEPPPAWVQLPDGRMQRSDTLPADVVQRLRAEGRLP
jgi:hypothetical protein